MPPLWKSGRPAVQPLPRPFASLSGCECPSHFYRKLSTDFRATRFAPPFHRAGPRKGKTMPHDCVSRKARSKVVGHILQLKTVMGQCSCSPWLFKRSHIYICTHIYIYIYILRVSSRTVNCATNSVDHVELEVEGKVPAQIFCGMHSFVFS